MTRWPATAAVLLGAVLGLSACTAAEPIGATHAGDAVTILFGYQCRERDYLQTATVGRMDGGKLGPAVWTIVADHAAAVPQLRVGTAPTGYRVTLDDLHGADLGLTFWVQATFAAQNYTATVFDLRKVKDGTVLDKGGGGSTPETFQKKYACDG